MKLSSAARFITNASDGYFGTSLSKPNYIDLIITKRCNFRCSHCDVWKNGDQNEMAHEHWLKILSQISQMGARSIIEISGGEPLLEKELSLKIAKEAAQFGLFASLNTNGALINRQIAEEILDSGFKSVKISLYSFDEDIHDNLRGMPGAFRKAKEALDFLKEKNKKNEVKIEVGMLLTGLNIAGIDSLIDYCKKNNFSLIVQPLDFNLERIYQENWQESSELWPTGEQVQKYLRPLIKNKPRAIKNPPFYLKLIYQYYLNPNSLAKRKCLAPYNNLVIWPNGDVGLCFRGNVVGNILSDSLKTIWHDVAAKTERKRLQFCSKSCKIIGCNMKRQLKDIFL